MNCSISFDQSDVRAPVWDSAFKIIEAPMSYINKMLNIHGTWFEIPNDCPIRGEQFDQDFYKLWKSLKKFNFTKIKSSSVDCAKTVQGLVAHLYNKKITILATVGQVIAYPISCGFTPITAIADIFAGIIQATIRAFQGASKGEIQSILHKKVIAAPAQQLAYTINNFVVLLPLFKNAARVAVIIAVITTIFTSIIITSVCVSAGLPISSGIFMAATLIPQIILTAFTECLIKGGVDGILLFSFVMGRDLYCNAQAMANNLPKFLVPDGYNIFIENGALSQNGHRFFDPEGMYTEFNSKQRNENTPYSNNFRASIEKELNKIENKAPNLESLRTWFDKKEEPYTLFGFKSKEEVNEEALKKSYKKLAFLSHPDKNRGAEEEAQILFKMVNTARLDIEKNILHLGR